MSVQTRFLVAAVLGAVVLGVVGQPAAGSGGTTGSGGRTWFVAPTGSGGGSCLTPDTTTIGEAIDASGPGDTIEVCPGTYHELIRVAAHRHDGLRLRSSVPWQAIVRPPELDPWSSTHLVAIGEQLGEASAVDRVTLEGFDLGAASVNGCTARIVAVIGGTGTTVERNVLRGMPDAETDAGCIAETAIETWDASVRIRDNVIEDPRGVGIHASAQGRRSVVVIGNVLRCCAWTQVPAELDPADGDEVEVDPTACDTQPSGIKVDGDRRGRAVVRGNLIEGRPGWDATPAAITPWCVGLTIDAYGRAPGIVVAGNVVRDALVGIDVGWDTTGITIAGNDVTGDIVACRDLDAIDAGGTTRSTWDRNIGTAMGEGVLSQPDGLCSPRSAPVVREPVTRLVDDDGTGAPDGGCSGTVPVFRRIQPAIDASKPGDSVRICPGSYTGAISVDTDDLTLEAATDAPVIRAARGSPSRALAFLDAGPPAGLVEVNADRVTIAGLILRPHGGPGRCRGLHRRDDPGALLRVWGGASVTVRDTVFTSVAGSPSCAAYDHGVLGSADGPPIAIDLERVVVRGFAVSGVTLTAFGHGEANDLVVRDSRFELATAPADRAFLLDGAVVFSGARLQVTDSVVDIAGGISASGIVAGGDDFSSPDIEISRNRITGASSGLLLETVGSGVVSENILTGSGEAGGQGIRVSGYPVAVQDNIVSGFGGAGLVAGETWIEDEVIPPHSFTGNDARGNAGIDCVDESAGPAEPEPTPSPYPDGPLRPPSTAAPTPGPALTLLAAWTDDRGDESMPDGLCGP